VAEHGNAKKGGLRWKRPRHTLKGRQDVDEVERSGLRLQLMRQQAETGDITLLFADESEALTHPYLSHKWAPIGADLRIEAPGQSHKRAILGARDAATGELSVITSATKRSSDFIHLWELLDTSYGPGLNGKRPVVLVLDNGPIHTSKATQAALAARPWLRVEWLPKYAPELNDIERDWRHLKRHFLANRSFADLDDLDRAIHAAIALINQLRVGAECADLLIAA
jgi:transposase